MAQEPSQDQITEWSAQTLHEGMKKSIISELAKVMLSNTEIFDQVFKVHSSLSGVDHCLGLIWKTYKSKNFMYLVDPRDREVLYPDYKERCPWLERSELHGGKANRRPEELDLRSFAAEACHCAWRIVENTCAKREKPFNFMGLPGELRNMIYGYLFQGAEISISVRTFRKYIMPCPSYFNGSERVRKVGVTAVREKFRVAQYDSKSRLHWDLYYAEFGNTVHKDQPKGISAAILRVNSHIHKEAEMILYKSHTFDFGVCPTAALAFFQTLPPAALPFIPRIRIDLYCTRWRNKTEFSKTCNALTKLAPNTRLATKLTIDFYDTDPDITSWPFVCALARMQGIKSLRSEKGKKFASDFLEMIRGASWVQSGHRGAMKEIEYTVR
ncbi:MAG: hypothetical protein L6R38_003786 [Xanthoria sp. 2 TBL-2021]|nr:MAG: hypothetical protein L6R38_003786 [Xanthoria sp. 2 TBL-2021]